MSSHLTSLSSPCPPTSPHRLPHVLQPHLASGAGTQADDDDDDDGAEDEDAHDADQDAQDGSHPEHSRVLIGRCNNTEGGCQQSEERYPFLQFNEPEFFLFSVVWRTNKRVAGVCTYG